MSILHSKKKGFTLIEMIVSLAIFSVVAVVALGALVRIISANQKAQAVQAAVTNVNFALESISRELRVGTGLVLVNSPINQPTESKISFISTRSYTGCELYNAYRFYTDPNIQNDTIHLQKAEGDVCGDSTLTVFIDITSPNITIKGGIFDMSSDPYKLVTMQLSGFAGDKEKNRTYFDVTTAISSRVR